MKFSKITISGKICTGKSTLHNLLVKKLGWQIYATGDLFREYVQKHNLSLEQADEQNDKLTKKIDGQVKKLLKNQDNLIVDSWLAGITAKNIPGVLKVLLVCKDNIRYKRFAKREKITFSEARQRVEERYNNWLEKMKQIYHRTDIVNEKHFDLIIDTSYITPQAVAKKVLQSIEE